MATTIVDITKDQMSFNFGGSLYTQMVELSAGGDPTVVILPIDAIQSIGVQSTDAPTFQVSACPRSLLLADTADWVDWDGIVSLNPCVTAVKVIPGVGTGRCFITVRTFVN